MRGSPWAELPRPVVIGMLGICSSCLIEPTPGYGQGTSTQGDASTLDTTGGSAGGSASRTSVDSTTASTTAGSDETETTDGATTGGPDQPGGVPKGYQPRGCGLDLDLDGQVGEEEDCIACNGIDETWDHPLGFVPTMVYVDCDTGVDSPTCGAPDEPCRTLSEARWRFPYLWDAERSGGNEMAVMCVRGTCLYADEPDGVVRPGGFRESYAREPVGSGELGVELPAAPTMYLGWDFDADGQYPPEDPDDIAVMQGNGNWSAFDLGLGVSCSPETIGYCTDAGHDIEIAHMVVSDFSAGVVFNRSRDEVATRVFVHDIVVQRAPLLTFQPSAIQDFSFENIRVDEHDDTLIAGAVDVPEASIERFRLANVTARALGADGNRVEIWDLPGWVGPVEIVDSVFDVGADDWTPSSGLSPESDLPPVGVTVGACNQSVLVRNNEFVDYGVGVLVEASPADTTCVERSVSDIRVDRNEFRTNDSFVARSHIPILVRSGASGDASPPSAIETVSVTSNAMISPEGWLGCARFRVFADTEVPGTIAFVGNTCIGPLHPSALDSDPEVAVLRVWESPDALVQVKQDFVVANNVVVGVGADDTVIRTDYAPAQWDEHHNVWSPQGLFVWEAGAASTLRGWQAASGAGQDDRACTPSFVGPADPHLAADDDCAASAAVELAEPADAVIDFDGEHRGVGEPWDAGADERTSE